MNNILTTSLSACILTTGLTSCVPLQQDSTVKNHPNIILILTDDQGWGDLSIHGNPNLHTPNIDAMVHNGINFDRFYSSPVCSPSRAEMLTGRYALRGGVYSTSTGGERLNLDEKTMAEYFKEAGYATATYGKWHNGMQPPYHPVSRGFDDFYGFCSGHWGDYMSPMMEHNGKIVHGNGYMSDDLTTHSINFIEKNQNTPFFILLSFNTPHSPMQVPDDLWATVKDRKIDSLYAGPEREDIEFTRAAIAMCENIDWNVGRIMQKLEQSGLDENTLVIFTSDNGPNSWRWNGNMKGRKGHTDEGGVRVPMIWQWKGTLQAGKTVPQIAAFTDLLPTLADLAGISFNPPKPLDGLSLKPLIMQESAEWPDRFIFNNWDGNTSVRTQQYRLDSENQLFDMVNDPGQTKDISGLLPDITAKLKKAARDYEEDVMKEFNQTGHRQFTVGHPDYYFTHLPARDAEATGSIIRSNRWPNCSFYTNWTSSDDYITWDVNVLESGVFEAKIWYTLAEENTRTRLALNFKDSALEFTITEAHDPPLEGMRYDRVKREESYVKDFIPYHSGNITLEKGSGTLTLRALEIPGNATIDFRQLILNRVE